MDSQEEFDLTEEEIEYLILKYIQKETQNGKKYVEARELYEYLGTEMPEGMEDEKIVLKSSAKRYIADFEAKYRPYLN
jgi:hypothetical protein